MFRKRVRKLPALLLLVISLLLLLFAGSFLRVDDGPVQAEAIVVIGGDHKPERVKRAIELYQQGYASIVVLSAGTLVDEGTEHVPEAEVMRRQALALGLPETALLMEEQSQSTYQNAYYTQAIAAKYGFKSLLLVTSAYQSRRAKRIFEDVLGNSVEIRVQAAPPDLCTLCWWFRGDEVGVVFYEYYNWGRYWLGIRVPSENRPGNNAGLFLGSQPHSPR